MDGNILFSWNGSQTLKYDVEITIDDRAPIPWFRVNGTQYIVEDALLYGSIRINVRPPGISTNNNLTYKGIFYIFNYCNSYIQ